MLKRLLRLSRRWMNEVVGRDVRVDVRRHPQALSLGSEYGGWTVRADLLNASSIAWSVGVGRDISFDLALIERFGVTVHAFDPTPLSVEWLRCQTLPDRFKHHTLGLADFDGLASFSPPADQRHVSFKFGGEGHQFPVRRIDSIARELGHDHIDLLKMDIEGAELGVIAALDTTTTPIRQLLVEFHHEIGRRESVQQVRDAIAALRSRGYRCFHRTPVGRELSFIQE